MTSLAIEARHFVLDGPYAYLIFEEEDSYKAKNSTGLVEFEGTLEKVMQDAVTDGRLIFVKPGTYVKKEIPGIKIPSNTKIIMSEGTTITFEDNVGDGAIFFENEDPVGGNDDISIIGGVLDGNKAKQGTTNQVAIKLRNSTKVRVECAIRNLRGKNIDADDDSVYSWINTDFPLGIPLPEGHRPNQSIGWKLFTSFEDDANWLGDGVVDNAVYLSGTKSLRVTVPGGSGATVRNVYSTAAIYRQLDNTKHRARIRLRTDNPSRVSYLSFRIYMPDSSNMVADYVFASGLPVLPANEWVYAYSGQPAIYGVPNPNNIAQCRIYCSFLDGPDPVNLWLDSVDILPSIAPYGVLSFNLDSAREPLFTKVLPSMRKFGFKGSLFPTVPLYPEYKHRLDDFKRLKLDGWDVYTHTHEGYITTNTDSENEVLRQEEIDYCIRHGFLDCRVSAPLGGTHGEPSLINTLRYFYALRAVAANYLNSIPPTYREGSTEGFVFHTRGTEPGGAANLAAYKAQVDEAIRSGQWVSFYLHEIGQPGIITESEWNEFLQYIKDSGIRVMPMGEIFALIDRGETIFDLSPTVDHFEIVLAESPTAIRSNQDLSGAIPITFTIDGQPDVPRTLKGSFDSHVNITSYTIVITGIDARGKVAKETFTQSNGWSWETRTAFASITSIVMTSRTGTGVGDTMDVGTGSKLGLSKPIYEKGDVYKVKRGNANIAIPFVDAPYGTVDCSPIAGEDYTIWYKTNLNAIV